MDHGFQTEPLATQTLELVWCALDHCPSAAWDVNPQATVADCESMIYTLMGYVSRKRPQPQWTVAYDYYQQALARGGSNWCVAASYLAQWYWTVPYNEANWTVAAAQNHTTVFCEICAASNYALVRQVRLEFDRQVAAGRLAADAWPDLACRRPPAPSSSSSSGLVPSGPMGMLWWMTVLLVLWKLSRC